MLNRVGLVIALSVLAACTPRPAQESASHVPTAAPSVPITIAQPIPMTPVTTPTTPTTPTIPTIPTPVAKAPDVTVELASVTLADECGQGPARKAEAAPARLRMKARADEAPGAPPRGRRRCEQTAMQVALVAGKGTGSTAITIKEVALFDTDGKALGTLAPGAATIWAGSRYQAWDGQLAPGQTARVSYALASPDWANIDGRHGKTFRVRVTVVVGTAEKTVERQVMSAPAMVEINVRT